MESGTNGPSASGDPTAIAQAVAKLDKLFDIAEVQLSRSAFLAGDDFTLADIQFGHVLFRYLDIPIVRQERPALFLDYADGPAFRWLSRMAF